MKNKSIALYFVYLWLFLFGFIPLCLVFIASLLSKDTMQLIALPFTLAHYQSFFSALMGHVLLRSFFMAGATTLACLILAYPFSYLMVRSKHQSLLLLLIIIPFWTSSLVRTYALVAILKFNGVLNALLLKLHIITTPLSLLYSNFAVLSGLIYTLFPFMVLPLYTNMERFDFKLLEAAEDLGANRWVLFTCVFLPNTTRGIISGVLLVFLPAMTLFYIPNVLGGARSILIGNLIQNQFFVAENWPAGAATSILLTIILLLLLLIYRKPQEVRR
ncbi:MAG: ABC transporter permease subunit [Legionellaceae bacterium]|nr:ABC transporter permease subunit [Legionellaceae bacterium]